MDVVCQLDFWKNVRRMVPIFPGRAFAMAPTMPVCSGRDSQRSHRRKLSYLNFTPPASSIWGEGPQDRALAGSRRRRPWDRCPFFAAPHRVVDPLPLAPHTGPQVRVARGRCSRQNLRAIERREPRHSSNPSHNFQSFNYSHKIAAIRIGKMVCFTTDCKDRKDSLPWDSTSVSQLAWIGIRDYPNFK